MHFDRKLFCKTSFREQFIRIFNVYFKSSYIPMIKVLLLTFSRFNPIHYKYSSSEISTWRHNQSHRIAYFTSLCFVFLHIIVFLEWFYLHPFASVQLWESVVMIYYLLIFSFTLISELVLGWRSAELKLLIDASMAMEAKLFSGRGDAPLPRKGGSVKNTEFLPKVLFSAVILNTPIVQGVGFLICMFFPCMPPLITIRSELCPCWVEGGDRIPLMSKLMIWLFTAASWSAVIGVTFTSFIVLLLYPTLVVELWIKHSKS